MTQICTGAFVSTASTPFYIPLSQQVNEFTIRNLTYSGVTALGVAGNLTSTKIIEAWFNPSYMTNGTALIKEQGTVSGILAPVNNGFAAVGGISILNVTNQALGAVKTINSFTPGTTTVFTCSGAHGFNVGDVVRIYNMTTAPEIGGVAMTVTATGGGGTTFTTLLNSSNSVTSVGKVVKVRAVGAPSAALYYPEYRFIAAVSLANPMVVTTLVQQNYAVGDVVTFNIPSAYGMQQLNPSSGGLPFQATVSAVNNAVGTQTVTFANVNSSAFTAFAWPGTGNYPISFPAMIPQGEGNLNQLLNIVPSPLPYGNQDVLSFAKQNLGFNGVIIGAGDGTNNSSSGGIIDTGSQAFEWRAVTSLQTFP